MPKPKLVSFAISLSLAAIYGSILCEGDLWAQSAKPHNHALADRGGPSPSAPGASVYFIDVKSGDTLQPRTIIHFGLRNMRVAPAGADRNNSGHHHLLIDTDLPPLEQPIPSDPNHLHFGAGQTEAEVTSAPDRTPCSSSWATRITFLTTPP